MTNGGGVGVLATDAAGRRRRPPCRAVAGDAGRARRRAAADLVARQPGRHHRRRAGQPLRRRALGPARGPRRRRNAGRSTARPPSARASRPRGRCSETDVGQPAHPLVAGWVGDARRPREARRMLERAGSPIYETPEEAVRGFMHLVRYRRNQELCWRRRRRCPRSSLRTWRRPPGDHAALWPRVASG